MKKILLITLLILLSGCSNSNNYEKTPSIKTDNITPSLDTTKSEDNSENEITIGLYKYYSRNTNRKLITEYDANWNYHQDISSFEVFYTNEEEITGNYIQDTFPEYANNYPNINNYKIGYIISFITNNEEINKTILSPKDTEEFFNYLEIYLYDDYHREKGVWYSHTTEEEFNENTLLTSIKLTAGKQIEEIISDIKVTTFAYNNSDFDENNNYIGNNKYTIIVKKSN